MNSQHNSTHSRWTMSIIRWTCHTQICNSLTQSLEQGFNKHRRIQLNTTSHSREANKATRNAKSNYFQARTRLKQSGISMY